jgi:hypothetical protein
MADFQSQAMGLTGLTIDASSTTPSRAEFSQFLNDGVIDVTSRWIAIRPQDIDNFSRESATTASNGFDAAGAKIIAVIREAGADGDTDGSTAWESCRKVPVSMQSRVVDVDSLSYASKYNPAYIIDSNGLINVYPTPDGTDDGYRVFYVNNSPEETDGSALDHASTGIKWFPNDKVYLVVLYASMRSLQAKMADTTISDLSITAVPPDVPTLSSITFSSIDSAVDATLVAAATSTTLGGSSTAPTYDTSVATSALGEANNFIDSDEDVELANAKLAEVQALMQDELNEFNQENIAFQAGVQEAMAEFQSGNQIAISNAERSQNRQLQNAINDMKAIFDDNAQSIQKFATELQEYQAETALQVQEYTQNLQADGMGYQWLQGQYAALKAEYDAAFAIAAPKPQAPARR